MKKIPSLFVRNYDGDRLVGNEVVPGSEWVIEGAGRATRKWDGTSCMVRDGVLFKRFDRKFSKRKDVYKPSPPGWKPCEEYPDGNTGHWPGWVPVGGGPEDKWHREAIHERGVPDGSATFELCGPKVQGNPEGLERHMLLLHGSEQLKGNPRTFHEIRVYLGWAGIEGIVWHHPDGRMVKIKAKDFGIARKGGA